MAVPVFLFCSFFLFFQKDFSWSISNYFSYLKKRFVRLIIPYYIFLLFFMPLIFLKEPKRFSFDFIWQSISIQGGVDISWLVLLFLQLTLLVPMLFALKKKVPIFFYCYIASACVFSAVIVFVHYPYSYKQIMWMPWSILIYFTAIFAKHMQQKKFIGISGVFSFALYILFIFILQGLHHSLSFYDNKYPPNFYFLIYGVFSILLLWIFGKWKWGIVGKFFTFLSIYSYSIFFIHYAVLYFVIHTFDLRNLNAPTLFLAVLLPTIAIQWGINKELKLAREINVKNLI